MSRHRRILRQGVLAFGLAVSVFAAGAAFAAGDCDAPAPVCDSRASVFRIAAFDPFGSAIRIAPDLLVTNRHVVADLDRAQVFTADGGILDAEVIPSGYGGDLILLRAEGLGPGPIAKPGAVGKGAIVYVVGADVATGNVRVFAPGPVVALPPPAHALARLHHGAYSQPGTSGGALVDGEGRLVAIVASGGEGRNEAIPADHLAAVQAASGPDHGAEHDRLSSAYRDCFELVDPRLDQVGTLDESVAEAIETRCTETGNLQYFDHAGQVLGRASRLDQSIAMFERAVAQDPNAFNARLGLLVSLHFAQRYADELPHIRILMETIPNDPQVLRFGIQAGKWAGERELAERAYRLLEAADPEMAPAARRFLDSEAPPPGRRTQ